MCLHLCVGGGFNRRSISTKVPSSLILFQSLLLQIQVEELGLTCVVAKLLHNPFLLFLIVIVYLDINVHITIEINLFLQLCFFQSHLL